MVVNLGIAMSYESVWGNDSRKFRLRGLKKYEKYGLGFAEGSVNPTVAGGGMDRVCPAKKLALLMGTTFLKYLNKAEWFTDPKVPIVFKAGGLSVSAFTLFHNNRANCRSIICGCETTKPWWTQNTECTKCVKKRCQSGK